MKHQPLRQCQTTTPGTTCLTLFGKCVGSLTPPANHVTLKIKETGPTGRLERRTIHRYNYKGSTLSSVILRPWVLVWSAARTLDLPQKETGALPTELTRRWLNLEQSSKFEIGINHAVVVRVFQTTQNLIIKRCYFAEEGKEIYQDLKRTTKTIVALINSFLVFSDVPVSVVLLNTSTILFSYHFINIYKLLLFTLLIFSKTSCNNNSVQNGQYLEGTLTTF